MKLIPRLALAALLLLGPAWAQSRPELAEVQTALRKGQFPKALEAARRAQSAVLDLAKAAPPSGALAKQLRYTPSDTDPSYLLVIVDEVEQIRARGDLNLTLHCLTDLCKALSTETKRRAPEPKERLAAWEQRIDGVGPRYRCQGLPLAAMGAFEAGEYGKAEAYAKELLRTAERKPAWPQSMALHSGHPTLGRLALRAGQVKEEKENLRLSAQVRGEGTRDSFGPDLQLARELPTRGEKTAVLQFLEGALPFWTKGGEKLALCKQMMAEGRQPALVGGGEKR